MRISKGDISKYYYYEILHLNNACDMKINNIYYKKNKYYRIIR
jgi:hypothetical protein